MARVLLLNPPAPGRPVLRDYACGEVTKADYLWAPVDLLVLSGLLDAAHELQVLDAIADDLPAAAALERAVACQPETVFSLTSAVSLQHDDRFLAALKERTGARVYGLGDVASFAPLETLAQSRAFDGFLQHFAEPTLIELAAGDATAARSVVLRNGGSPTVRPVRTDGPLRYGRPRHDLFPLTRYRLPFTRWRSSTTVLTRYGCPFPCTFCASRNLPGQERALDDVIDELRFIQELGVAEVYVRDFTFGPTRRRAQELCQRIVDAGLRLRWSAECRLDVLDDETLRLMARAGCEVILVGVETGDAAVGRKLGKTVQHARTRQILQTARDLGIRACGHFVLGSPDETREQIAATIRFARGLPLDYASFNLYAPRLATDLRDQLIAAGRVTAGDLSQQDVSAQAKSFAQVDAAELRRLFRWAVLSFFLHPSRVARLLTHTPWSTLARQGGGVLRSVVGAHV
ncbi:radical SAM protein [bacterium]|nr:radical SAM protein [bacterium]